MNLHKEVDPMKEYKKIDFEVIEFGAQDVIVTSNNDDETIEVPVP